MAKRVKLNLRGLEQVANLPAMRREVQGYTVRTAAAVRAMGIRVEGSPGDATLPVEHSMTVTRDMQVDRVKGYVTIAHAAGQAVQAKHGALTKAAAQVGLKVKAKR